MGRWDKSNFHNGRFTRVVVNEINSSNDEQFTSVYFERGDGLKKLTIGLIDGILCFNGMDLKYILNVPSEEYKMFTESVDPMYKRRTNKKKLYFTEIAILELINNKVFRVNTDTSYKFYEWLTKKLIPTLEDRLKERGSIKLYGPGVSWSIITK